MGCVKFKYRVLYELLVSFKEKMSIYSGIIWVFIW